MEKKKKTNQWLPPPATPLGRSFISVFVLFIQVKIQQLSPPVL